jgi:hypothetical protein
VEIAMTRKEAIQKMKSRIKQLAAEQKVEKKIVRSDHAVYNAKYEAWADQVRAMGKRPWEVKDGPRAMWRVWDSLASRRGYITACLNVYNEMRGKSYRHINQNEDERRDVEDLERGLRHEFGIEESVVS